MAENVANAKRALRERMLKARALSAATEAEAELTANLLSLISELGVKRIGCYWSFGSEPPTEGFIAQARANGLTISCPRVTENSQMEFVLLDSKFQQNPMGFFEPQGEAIAKSEIELLVIPALAIDSQGNRLGRGGGFFDRFLEEFSGVIVALVFEAELVEALPTEEHDRKVDFAITPEQIVRF